MHLARYHGDSYWINGVLERLALAAALSGDAMRAARLAGYCEAAYQLDSAPRERVEHRTWQTLVERLDAALAPAEKSRLMADGAAWDEDQAVAAALEQ